ncbi:MAG: C26 family cysteine hydrolase domain-containing family, partial [Chlorobiaceae bacterium]|nr:C26 family cysteine hydrolase domain-containing family [Chlorobiaceae bacterium]
NLPWSIALERWIPGIVEAAVPFLGICYGHQLLGRATGGEVGYHPLGRELGTVEIRLESEGIDDPLFSNIPETFMAHSAHSQSVLRLPPGAVLLASGKYEPYHSFRIGKAAWGVQFHPEYSADIMSADICEGENDRTAVQKDLPAVADTPFAAKVLANFADYVSSDMDE